MIRISYQKNLPRTPRIHIVYDVHVGDAIEKKELPFVVGVLADLVGERAEDDPLPKLRRRSFDDIDIDNFDQRMNELRPRVPYDVKNRLSSDPDARLRGALVFRKLEDFEEHRLADA